MRFMGATTDAQAAAQSSAAAAVDPGQHYQYGVQAVLTANGTTQATFTVINHDFEADFLVSQSTGLFNVRIQVGDRYLSNIATHVSNSFGTAQAPFPLLAPLKLKKNTIVTISITDLSGGANTVNLGFIGRELN
jgi:hypothetical protein